MGGWRMSDEELVRNYQRDRDHELFEELARRYRGLLSLQSRRRHLRGGDYDDLFQTALFGLFRAAVDYRADRGASFCTFAILCINSSLTTLLREDNCRKSYALNNAVPLEEQILMEYPAEYQPSSIERFELPEVLKAAMENELTALERRCIACVYAGMSIADISERYGYSCKQVDNALFRARRKLKAAAQAYMSADYF